MGWGDGTGVGGARGGGPGTSSTRGGGAGASSARGGGAPRWREARPEDKAFALACCAVLAAYNNVLGVHPWHSRRYVRVNLCATGTALAAAALSGLTQADLGLGRGRWLPGRTGYRLAATVGAGWLLVAVVPAARPLLGDKRITSLGGRAAAYQALIRIPVGTALWEEIAFRGVLQAALRRVMPRATAIAVTSCVFGLWHIRPTLQALRANGLASTRGRAVAGVAAAVATTTAGGVVFSWLRERSGSLTAPILLHVATNSGGLIAAVAVAAADPAVRRGLPENPPACRDQVHAGMIVLPEK
jgi:membrane protease YdiL (CAAX protease family)